MEIIIVIAGIVGWIAFGLTLIFIRKKGEMVIYLQNELEKTKKELEKKKTALTIATKDDD